MSLLIENPPRRGRRKARKTRRRRRRALRSNPLFKRRRRRASLRVRRRRATSGVTTVARFSRKRRRRRSRGGFGGGAQSAVKSFISPANIKNVALTTAGYIGADKGVDWLAQQFPQMLDTAGKRTAAKFAVALAGGVVLSKAMGGAAGAAFAAGAAANGGVELFKKYGPQFGINGLGAYDYEVLAGYGSVPRLAGYSTSDPYSLAGVDASWYQNVS